MRRIAGASNAITKTCANCRPTKPPRGDVCTTVGRLQTAYDQVALPFVAHCTAPR